MIAIEEKLQKLEKGVDIEEELGAQAKVTNSKVFNRGGKGTMVLPSNLHPSLPSQQLGLA
jgi:hypothetical protein